MMHLQWLQNPVETCCPICGETGEKQAVLSTDHVLAGHGPVTLVRCPCGVAFLLDQNPPDYEHGLIETLDYYVEQGAGIDLIVEPLLRLAPGTVRRCLEVGCSYGFALDFGRFAFGWEVLGVDPSPLAEMGSEALGLPVHGGYFDADLDLGPEPFDLALCSEVVEHLAQPRALLSALRERLSGDGLLVLSTPNLAVIRPETEEGALRRAVSPGFHLVLYDAASLARLLESAGFSPVRIEESPETLRAFAGVSEAALQGVLPAVPPDRRGILRGYFRERAAAAPPGSPLACGFAYRHFKECVNAGRYEEAVASRELLTRVWREGYGLDLERPETVTAALASGRSWAGAGRLPFNVTGALFFSGILELNHLGNPGRAAESFAAAAAAGDALVRSQQPFGLADGETEALLRQSRKHLPMALAATDPDRAVREVEALESHPTGDAGFLDGTRAQTFIRLVNAGAYEAAQRLAPGISRRIDSLGAKASREDLDSLFCLGMLALLRRRSAEAAELFGRVRRLGTPEHDADLLESARRHEELSRWQAR
jgi:SAM-dependent methyltransferase